MELQALLGLLESLSQDQSSALSVYDFLCAIPCYSEEFNLTNEMAADHEHDNGWIRMSATLPFAGLWSGNCIIIIQLGTERVVIN